MIDRIGAGESYRVYFRTPEVPEISDIVLFASRTHYNAKLSVESSAEKPEKLEKPAAGEVYRYFRISYTRPEYLERVRITFRVNLSWMEENRINSSSVVLMHFVNESWQALPTVKLREALGYAYYSAETENLSWFAVVAERLRERAVRKAATLPLPEAPLERKTEEKLPPAQQPTQPSEEASVEIEEVPVIEPVKESRSLCAPVLPVLLLPLALLWRIKRNN